MTAVPDTGLLAPGQQTQPFLPQPEAGGTPTSRLRAGQMVVTLPEQIDVGNDVQVEDALLRAALQDGTTVLVADGGRTTFCGCAGVAALIRTHHQAAAVGVQMRVVAGSPGLRRMLELTGADDVLDIYATLSAALAGGLRPAPQLQRTAALPHPGGVSRHSSSGGRRTGMRSLPPEACPSRC